MGSPGPLTNITVEATAQPEDVDRRFRQIQDALASLRAQGIFGSTNPYDFMSDQEIVQVVVSRNLFHGRIAGYEPDQPAE